MKNPIIAARLDPQSSRKLEQLAKATARPKSFLIAEAVRAYIKEQAWQIEAIEEGIRQADAGIFADDKEVKKVFAKWGVNAA